MQSVIPVYKNPGETPLEAIKRFQQRYPEYNNHTLSYAGRLDPLAEGVLLLLVDEENKKRNEYEHLRKTYEFTVLLGITTDTYDCMGKIITVSPTEVVVSEKKIVNSIIKLSGTRNQMYPPYSSKTVHGKPLYWWARENKLHEIILPKHQVTIDSFDMLETNNIEKHLLLANIEKTIAKVNGNFRQQEILALWHAKIDPLAYRYFPTISCLMTCTSGTYVRTLCDELGKLLGTGALALHIKRITVGNFTAERALKV